jgi:type I restriction enzyme S subunit
MVGKYQAYPEYKDSGTQWIGDMPINWTLFYGKRLFKNRRELSFETDEQLAASQKYGVVPQSLMMKLNDSKVMLALKGTASFRHVDRDDFVISLRSFEGGIEHSKYAGCVSPAYTVLSATKDISPSFYRYLFKSKPYIAALQSTTDSLRDGKSITFDQFGAIPLVQPKTDEQQKIADFLDHETAKIDTLIEKQQQLIKLLKEKRQAVISHAVTKGLNPNAPMRDSGVVWLGEVPEHWSVCKLKNIIDSLESGVSVNAADLPAQCGELGVLKTSCVYTRVFRIEENKTVVKDEYERVKCPIRKGAIIISRMNTPELVGASAIVDVDDPNIFLPDRLWQTVFKNEESQNATFIAYFMMIKGFRNQISLAAEGASSSMQNIAQGDYLSINLTFPDSEEQGEIVCYLKKKISVFNRLERSANEAINLMQERRTALISAAVTGKIDVRNWQAPKPSNTNNKEVAA